MSKEHGGRKHDHGDGHDHAHSHSHASDDHAHSHSSDSHDHSHDHSHSHADGATERKQSSRLLIVLGLIASFFVVELIGARIAKSDVLEADAFHLLMDVFAISISLFAMRLSSRRPSSRFTWALIAAYCSSGAVRSPQSFSVTK